MRIHSTRESVEAGEISVLAIVETLAAMLLSIFIAVQFGTLKWIAVSCCVAPLLLLRTEKSVSLCLKMFESFETWLMGFMKRSPERIKTGDRSVSERGILAVSVLFSVIASILVAGPLSRIFQHIGSSEPDEITEVSSKNRTNGGICLPPATARDNSIVPLLPGHKRGMEVILYGF